MLIVLGSYQNYQNRAVINQLTEGGMGERVFRCLMFRGGGGGGVPYYVHHTV
jgi:hypothetical protein